MIPGPYARAGGLASFDLSNDEDSDVQEQLVIPFTRADLRTWCGVAPREGSSCVGHPGMRGSALVRPKISVTADEAAHLLQGIVAVDLYQLKKAVGGKQVFGRAGYFPILRGIQQGTVRYDRYDPEEEWKTWRQLMTELQTKGRATGDCEDLATAVTAELQFAGIPARTYVYKSGPALYHVVVKTEKFGLLDPSRGAGMDGNG